MAAAYRLRARRAVAAAAFTLISTSGVSTFAQAAAPGGLPSGARPAPQAAVTSFGEASRQALAQRDYPRTVEYATQALRAGEGPSALLNYRLAIAYARQGQFQQAASALQRAEAADPRLGFASSAAMVEALRRTIEQGIAQMPAPAPVQEAAPARAADEDGIEVAASQAVASPLAEAEPVRAAVEPLQAPLQTPAASDRAGAGATQPAAEAGAAAAVGDAAILGGIAADAAGSTGRTEQWIAPLWMQALVVAGAIAALAYFAGLGALHLMRLRRQHAEAAMPLLELVTRHRDMTALVMSRLELPGHSGSALYAALAKALPRLEYEAGRAQRTSLPARAMQDFPQPPRPVDPQLGETASTTIAQRALQATVGVRKAA